MRGKVVVHDFESRVLKSNPLKDPDRREVIVYLPSGYRRSDSRGYVTAYGIAGFAGNGRMLLNADPLGEGLEQRMNRLISSGKCGPMILVLLDCFTRFGGNQYINSTATGRYEDYIVSEIVPFIDRTYNCAERAVWGKSSGGYGSMVLGMRNPDVFQALADHSGDSFFEYSYLSDFPKALEEFRKAGGPRNWLKRFWAKPNRRLRDDAAPLNIFAMAAHYSPNPRSRELGVDFPFDLETGELIPKVWKRWLAWDPVRMAGRYAANLKKLKLIYIDCGTKDEFNLLWGSRILHSKLQHLGVRHHYEEFDDGHMNISYRYDVSLPMIQRALAEAR